MGVEHERKDIWLWLANIAGGNTKIVKELISEYEDITNIYEASDQVLMASKNLTDKEKQEVIKNKADVNINVLREELKQHEVHFVTLEENAFPQQLIRYKDCPNYLFYRGNLPKDYVPSVAIVGARACSNYGRVMAKRIGNELSQAGVQVISGMARGIDTFSQNGATEGRTPTFAVLGCGVDICYPTENVELYEAIINGGGGIISEYPLKCAPLAWHFPMRNRIISGLSDKIIVIEARENSGSLITVEWALEQGKDVYALPGRVNDALSVGCNRLIKAGAEILTDTQDILSDFDDNIKSIDKISKLNKKNLEKDLFMVYSCVGFYPKSVATIIEETGLDYDKVMELLLELQLMGLVEEIYKNFFVRGDAA